LSVPLYGFESRHRTENSKNLAESGISVFAGALRRTTFLLF